MFVLVVLESESSLPEQFEAGIDSLRAIKLGAVVAKNSRRFYCGYYVYPKEQA
jgi:hypothetical protein